MVWAPNLSKARREGLTTTNINTVARPSRVFYALDLM